MARTNRKYSWADQQTQHSRLSAIFFFFFFTVLFYLVVSSFVLHNRVIQNGTMRPGIQEGDRIIFLSWAFPRLFPGFQPRLRRGELVLVDRLPREQRRVFVDILETVVRFFTAEQAGISRRASGISVKRVIGFPGDEISMVNFVIRVKPGGANIFLRNLSSGTTRGMCIISTFRPTRRSGTRRFPLPETWRPCGLVKTNASCSPITALLREIPGPGGPCPLRTLRGGRFSVTGRPPASAAPKERRTAETARRCRPQTPP